MKVSKLPLPVLILIVATLFLLSSAFGEWIGRPAAALRAPAPQTVEQQQSAVLYLRAMAWLSRVINHHAARAENKVEAAQPAEPIKAPTHAAAPRRAHLCALSKPLLSSTTQHRSVRSALSCPQQTESSRPDPAAAGQLRESSTLASGS